MELEVMEKKTHYKYNKNYTKLKMKSLCYIALSFPFHSFISIQP